MRFSNSGRLEFSSSERATQSWKFPCSGHFPSFSSFQVDEQLFLSFDDMSWHAALRVCRLKFQRFELPKLQSHRSRIWSPLSLQVMKTVVRLQTCFLLRKGLCLLVHRGW